MQSFDKSHSSEMAAVPSFNILVVYTMQNMTESSDTSSVRTPQSYLWVTMSMYTCCLNVAKLAKSVINVKASISKTCNEIFQPKTWLRGDTMTSQICY